MAILKAEAIVLKTYDFRETSLIAHLFTREYGRLDGILKGIRSDSRKFASNLEPFSLNDIIFYQARNSGLHLISQCDLKDDFSVIRNNLKSIAHASYIMDLIGRLMQPDDKNIDGYELTLSALKQMSSGYDAQKVLYIFLIKFLKSIGFRPRLDGCIACDRDISAAAFFNVRRGGLVCARCGAGDSYSTDVLGGTIASILHIEEGNWEDALRLGLSAKVRDELKNILHNFMEFHLQLRPKSGELLEVLQ
ncbi:MAG: DNA repair protein RecO [Omnitrophica WOR_2 bacterium RIFCSPLOWO2_12_FULL_46_30]|nr:MAG: DNA repair protein RecO [Omnitrophica WOR_2 bacterium RIFCSPHIGHO2_02_FULL_46_37]OGX42725.1 MAG: DNA repair protein RecO [Omnitrophica WOR_2 bacterium RIFCSPLOWO2_02_FULL_45_28]OGX52240.1 MAG: DNA repair protein RecO [Omnitrophica WOR_2 bacterium RIFCSPLOWO2_12_FULL_46_30]